jgi:hypothetical protein
VSQSQHVGLVKVKTPWMGISLKSHSKFYTDGYQYSRPQVSWHHYVQETRKVLSKGCLRYRSVPERASFRNNMSGYGGSRLG